MTEYLCDIKIENNVLNLANPFLKTITINLESEMSGELTNFVELVDVIGPGSYGIKENLIKEIKTIQEKQILEVKSALIIPNSEIVFPSVEARPTYFQNSRNEFVESPDNQTIVNPETNKTYAITSKTYHLLKHETAIDEINNLLLKNKMTDYKNEIEISKDGAMIVSEWKFPKLNQEVVVGDVVCPSLKMINSYDTSHIFEVAFCAERLVCSNGMTRAEKLGYYRKKHTIGLEIEIMKNIIQSGIQNFQRQIDNWKTWNNFGVTQTLLTKTQKVFDKTAFKKEIYNLKEIGSRQSISSVAEFQKDAEGNENLILKSNLMNAWILFNIATQYITHHIKDQKKRVRTLNKLGDVYNRI